MAEWSEVGMHGNEQTTPQEPAMGVSDEMIAAAASAYNSAAVAEGFHSVIPSLDATHLRWMRAALLAALPHMQPAGEAVALTLGQRAVARELLICCESWEPNVCVMGNVRAKDAADLLRFVLATPPQPSAEEAPLMKCICTAEGAGCTNRCDRGQLPPIPAERITIPQREARTTQPAPVDVRLRELAELELGVCNGDWCWFHHNGQAWNGQVYPTVKDANKAKRAALLSAQPSADAGDAAIAAQREAGEG